MRENLLIAYGTKNITLNKGEQHMALTEADMAFIVQSALRNMALKIDVTSQHEENTTRTSKETNTRNGTSVS
jgi:hypothetical protein